MYPKYDELYLPLYIFQHSRNIVDILKIQYHSSFLIIPHFFSVYCIHKQNTEVCRYSDMTLYVKQKDARNLLSSYSNQEYTITVRAIHALLYYLNQNYSPNTTSSFQQIFIFRNYHETHFKNRFLCIFLENFPSSNSWR